MTNELLIKDTPFSPELAATSRGNLQILPVPTAHPTQVQISPILVEKVGGALVYA